MAKGKNVRYLWEDKIRHLGIPVSFTTYRLSEDRIFCEKGLFSTREEQIMLYRIQDMQLSISFSQRLFGVGSIRILSTDKSAPKLDLVNIAKPREVKELIHEHMETAKLMRRVRLMEVMGQEDGRRFTEEEIDAALAQED